MKKNNIPRVEDVSIRRFVNSINTPVTVFSKETVNVSSKNPGIVEKNNKSYQALNIAKQNVELAKISIDKKKITLERLKEEYENSLKEKTRHESLLTLIVIPEFFELFTKKGKNGKS